MRTRVSFLDFEKKPTHAFLEVRDFGMLTGWGSMMTADGDLPTQVDAVLSKPPRINELRETLFRVTQEEPV